jgi:hypothetical protein
MAHRRRRPHHLLEGSATPSEATLQPEEVGAPEEEIRLAQPARAVSELRQIHSALLPEPHDLDPYVPIGIRIGSFLLFPELEVGADMTNNVLDTRFDTRSDIGPEVKPRLRLDSDWSTGISSASRPMPTASGTATSRSQT